MVLTVQKLTDEHKLSTEKSRSDMRVLEYEKQMASIQPKLIEAMITMGGLKTTEILAKNIKEQGTPLSTIFQKGGLDGLLDPIKNTPLYDNVMNALDEYKKLSGK